MEQVPAPKYTWRSKLVDKIMGTKKRSFRIGYNREARELYAVTVNKNDEIIALMIIDENQIPLLRQQLDQVRSMRMLLGHEATVAEKFTEETPETWSEEDLKILRGTDDEQGG